MGIGIFHGSSCNCGGKAEAGNAEVGKAVSPFGNPDPEDFTVLDAWETRAGRACVLRVRYAGATNYEGIKILVYLVPLWIVSGRKRLDPHFCDGPGCLSPVARMEPTERGWRLAQGIAQAVEDGEDQRGGI